MIHLFTPYTKKITKQIADALAEKQQGYEQVSPWGKDSAERLTNFATQGKLIRGALVLFSSEMFKSPVKKDAVTAAAAIEMIHSSLLIHDDIMDNDPLRRGQPSIYKQYEAMAKQLGRNDAEHVGISLGICVGDIGYFLAWEMLGEITHKKQKEVMRKIAHEVSLVGVAQMQDVTAYDGEKLDRERILHMYQFKTGRYSFSLPLAIGALLANQSDEVIKQLERFGETVGILFQLADDNLGLFGTPEKTGKMVGSDIKENKQTLYRAMLFQHASDAEKKKLTHLFGNQNINESDIAYIHTLVGKYAIDEEIRTLCKTIDTEAQSIIKQLPITNHYKEMLSQLVIFIQTRNK